MSITGRLIQVTQDVFVSMGAVGLFAIAFVESSFFPIPPDVVLIPLVLSNPELAMFYAALATVGSVLGAVFGYWLGYKGGRPVLERFVSDQNIQRVEDYYDKYGVYAVGIAGFTPVPYKVFTISSGTFQLRLIPFVIVSTLSRGARFFLEALLLLWYGEEIISFLHGTFGVITVIIAILAVTAYIIWKRYL